LVVSGLRLAYGDPPYAGQAKRHYAHDPSGIEAAEVDFPALIAQLRSYDGWAMSASSPSLGYLLSLAPEARVAAWVKPFCSWKPTHRVQYSWEPVLFVPARPKGTKGRASVRDFVSANITTRRGTHGAKPDAFCDWILDLIGAEPADHLDDLFPGSGAVGLAWDRLVAGGSAVLAGDLIESDGIGGSPIELESTQTIGHSSPWNSLG
jgi:hypothetical protein